MLGSSYFIWKKNKEWYEMYDIDEEEGTYKVRLTEKAPPEAVESFERYQKKQAYAREHGILY